jgi:hypothetical protein
VTDDLSPAQRESLEALRAARGACPPAEALVDYEASTAADRERHRHHAHIAMCSRCQLAVMHIAEPAVTRSAMAKWLLPIAAIVVLGIGVTLVNRQAPAVAPPDDTIRGTELQVTAPAGAVEIVREFAWQSPIRAERYRVIVRRGSTVVWQTETTGLSVAPPPAGVIQRDVQYEWQVEAIDREGTVRMTSPPQPFSVF